MNRPFTMAADGLERHRFSTADIDRMVEAGVLDAEGAYELIDGEIVPMASQYTPQARMVGRLFRRLSDAIDPASFEVLLGATVELSPFSRFDPDIYVARAGVDSKIVPVSSVVWAIEIADATRRKDLKVKAPLYAAAGVPEYWVVDLEEHVTHIHREPTSAGWSSPVIQAPFAEPIAPAMFRGLALRIADI